MNVVLIAEQGYQASWRLNGKDFSRKFATIKELRIWMINNGFKFRRTEARHPVYPTLTAAKHVLIHLNEREIKQLQFNKDHGLLDMDQFGPKPKQAPPSEEGWELLFSRRDPRMRTAAAFLRSRQISVKITGHGLFVRLASGLNIEDARKAVKSEIEKVQ